MVVFISLKRFLSNRCCFLFR